MLTVDESLIIYTAAAGDAEDPGGIELPQQTYPQMLERTIGAP